MENAFGSHASFACARRGRNVSQVRRRGLHGSVTDPPLHQAPGFTVNHFAYPVYYNVDGFVDKVRQQLCVGRPLTRALLLLRRIAIDCIQIWKRR